MEYSFSFHDFLLGDFPPKIKSWGEKRKLWKDFLDQKGNRKSWKSHLQVVENRFANRGNHVCNYCGKSAEGDDKT